MKRTFAHCAPLALLLIAAWLPAAPFEPSEQFTLEENWRWHELEPLSHIIADRGIEDANGNLIFPCRDSLIRYDGYNIEEIPYPVKDPAFKAFELFYSKNGYLYLATSDGIFGYRNGEWTRPIPHYHGSVETRSVFAKNAFGLEIVALPIGLYRIDETEFVKIDVPEGKFLRASFDSQNRLWCILAKSYEVARYQFDGTRLKEPLESKVYDLGLTSKIEPWVVAAPFSDEVWVVNQNLERPAIKLDDRADAWIPFDLMSVGGDNSHISGHHINGADMLMFSKNALLVRHKQKWHSLAYPEFKFPSVRPFFILRANGNLILGGRGEKIYEIDYNSEKAISYNGLHFQCDTPDQRRWFLSIDGAIVEQDTLSESWIRHDENVIDTPLVIIRSSDGVIWAAGAHRGVAAVCYYDNGRWTLDTFPELNSTISHLSARQIPNGDVLFGSGEHIANIQQGGLIAYRKSDSGYQHHYAPPPIVPRRPVGFAIGRDQQLWLGGLNLVRTDQNLRSLFQTCSEFAHELWIDHLAEDQQGSLWVAQWDRGLFQFDGKDWIHHNQPEKIASRQVSYVMKDDLRENNLWFATDLGISRFDGQTWYPHALPKDLRLNRESGTLKQSSDGAIWTNIGSRSWFFRQRASFQPTAALRNTFRTVRYQLDPAPPIVSINSPIPTATSPANVFIEWSGVDQWSHSPKSKLRYSYRIDGGAWSKFDESASKAFLDIASGDHRVEVRALDLDGNISTAPAAVSFSVTPPVWQRPWFIALAALALLTICLLIYLLLRQRIRHIIQLDEIKLQFFTNISHELRTPLTVILGPLESQLSKPEGQWKRKPLETAHKNALKMLALVDQILDFRSAETGNIPITPAKADIVATIAEVLELIKPLADERAQNLSFHCQAENCVVWCDAEKIEKILNNLIGNAVKYTHEGGSISVKIELVDFDESIEAVFVVEDNGVGIPTGKIEGIFEMFHRINNPAQRRIRGFGIGLAYTKSLIEACEGSIAIESPIAMVNGKAQGTRFTVSLPLKKEFSKSVPLPENIAAILPIEQTVVARNAPEGSVRPLVLLAEDDQEVRSFLSDELSHEYQVLTAADGHAAMALAIKHIPDVVITDVMMREMDGRELCRQIKTNEPTSHIPVLMLTALKSERHEIEGLHAGADDYLSKPVRLSILKLRIQNILENRRKIHDRFRQQIGEAKLNSKEIATNPVDEAFLSKIVSTIESNIDDPTFDVEALASKLYMSRMTLYRKFKAITGDSPSAFIRSIRMNKAAALLATKEHSVAEIADIVGMPDSNSFSTIFKKHFKVTPSQYALRNT